MRSIVVAALLAATAASPALAQDKAPFSGAHVEGLAGWDRVQANNSHDDGVNYGIAGGYDFAGGGNTRFGIEGEVADSNTKDCVGATTAANPRVCVKTDRDLYIGGRIGTVVSGGKALLYAKAGYTNARAKLTQDSGTGQTTLDHKDLNGARVGVGAEYALTSNSYIKTEYRYSNYQDGVSRNQVVAGFGLRF